MLVSVGRRNSVFDSSLFSLFLACLCHSMMAGMWAHLDLLETAAEKNPKPLICVGKTWKMCSAYNLLPQKLEGKYIIYVTFFLRG